MFTGGLFYLNLHPVNYNTAYGSSIIIAALIAVNLAARMRTIASQEQISSFSIHIASIGVFFGTLILITTIYSRWGIGIDTIFVSVVNP